MTNVYFSIVIPTYNRGHLILPTLRTLQHQSFHRFEVIIVDDGSKDDTEEVVKSLNDDRFIYVWKENGERGAARNFGAAMAKGEYILFLDSDDYMHPDALHSVYNRLHEVAGPIPMLVCGYDIRKPGMSLSTRVNNFEKNDLKCLIYGNPFACGAVFVHTSIFARFAFCEKRDVARCEDWEYWIRLAANVGYEVFNRPIAYIIDHPQRSIRLYDSEGLIQCKNNAITEAFKDAGVQKHFAGSGKKIHAWGSSYISLHLSMLGYKLKTLRYFFRSVGLSPGSLFTRRTLAIAKHLIFKW